MNNNVLKHYLFTRYYKHSKIPTRNQIGGDEIKSFKVLYDGNEYVFYKNEIDVNYYTLHSIDEKDDCVIIEINKQSQVAHIQNINGINKTCVHSNNDKVGSTLLKITLKLLTKLHKLNIKTITLNDESYKICLENNKQLDMKIMEILRTGDTWYGRYGFRPVIIDVNNNVLIDEYNNKIYERNKYIMNTITVSSVNLINFFTNHKSIDKLQLHGITKIINKYPNMLVKDFINKFLTKYDERCKVFSSFYIELYDYLQLIRPSSIYGVFL